MSGIELSLYFLGWRIGISKSRARYYSLSPSMSKSIEEKMLALAWKVELPQKWELLTYWGNSGADFESAPFRITREPQVLKESFCCS